MMKTSLTLTLTLALAVPLIQSGCKKDDSDQSAKPATPAETKPADTQTATPDKVDPARAAAAIDAVLAPYETCRALLASDDGKLAECAGATAKAATEGAAQVAAAARPHMAAMAAAANKLAAMPADDMDALRLAFGELSKPAVALLMAAPDAAAKYHMFECPMAEGFQRWIQPGAELSNPYMGTRMPSCGSEVHDHHAGAKQDHKMDGHGDMQGHEPM